MADERISLEAEREEPVYIMAPHPAARVVSGEKTVAPGEPEVAEETLADLVASEIQEQMGGLRSALITEIQIELQGGSKLNAKN
ncbi:MAG: hypothetical protein FWF69_06660 [Firmicutes bacterium]|nr:hypothetical protein [Bacillota bacterium]